jgi:outer membrane protein assembly factor BamB
MVDVDSSPIVVGSVIYSLAYNGNLLAVDVRSGQIQWKKVYSSYRNLSMNGFMLYLTDYVGHVYAVDSRDGSELWQQTGLSNRGLTGAYSSGDHVVVGDNFGYLHWLAKDTGEFVARKELDDTGFYVEAVGKDNTIVVQTRDICRWHYLLFYFYTPGSLTVSGVVFHFEVIHVTRCCTCWSSKCW